tara:strand:+ start:1913 stop:2992 length:1080 start_codon:yes stop_codon:yes gene_type:complete
MLKKYQIYIATIFFKNLFFISLIFLGLVFILNFFEELKFFENYNVGLKYPVFLTFLNSPSILFELFPFIFLIAVKFFYIHLNERNELEIFKNHGIDNLNVLYLLSVCAIICGAFVLLVFYTLSSNLKNHYLNLKNKFSSENEYLAVVNENGLWIKEEIDGKSNIIHAKKFNKNIIEDITITQSGLIEDNLIILTAKSGDISNKIWILNNVKIVEKKSGSYRYQKMNYTSSFDGETISNLFSNLNSLNLYQLNLLLSSYTKIGYSTTDVNVHINKLYSMPVFYLLMTILGLLIMIKFTFIKTKFFIVIIGVSVSVLVYYINYFSSLFGSNETIPIVLSIWLPHLILFLLCMIGGIKLNES